MRTEGWRYIRHADGSEEFYDEKADPLEYTNLADDPRYLETKRTLQQHLPQVNQPTMTRWEE
ncbi:MAG: hypothetical protein ACREIA_27205 [Opitutaceae bacterium]